MPSIYKDSDVPFNQTIFNEHSIYDHLNNKLHNYNAKSNLQRVGLGSLLQRSIFNSMDM